MTPGEAFTVGFLVILALVSFYNLADDGDGE